MTTNVPEEKRAAQIAAIHDLADWLAEHPAVPVPSLNLHRHLTTTDMSDEDQLALVRRLAVALEAGTDETLVDRTVLRHKVNEHVSYELFAWHRDGRDKIGELERLRARVAELEAAKPASLVPEPIAAHYDTTDAGEESCACGEVFPSQAGLQLHIAEGNAKPGPRDRRTCAAPGDQEHDHEACRDANAEDES